MTQDVSLLNGLDLWIIGLCLAVAFLPALILARRAGSRTSEFFASGRSAPWWLVGTSMVATTFSTDTPNFVTNLVRVNGVAHNWVWWAFLLTGMATVFFYARLWRRSGVLTDLEFYELRYSGRSAAFLRGFRAVYLGLFFNAFIMASVTLAAAKIANVMLGWSRIETVLICGALCIGFSVLSGLWGVMAADIVQFVIAMVGVFAAAWYALDHPDVGGMDGLLTKIDPDTLRLLPDFADWETTLVVLILPLTVQWWSVWYPGAEPGGGSYIAQRMLAAKDEKHALLATLWFNVAHYALRPWPWILVALASMLVFPTLQDIQTAFPHVDPELLGDDMAYPAMLSLLPHGLLGLLIASLLSAYVSTMSTHLNWGSSYLVNDFYKRFCKQDASEKHLVRVARFTTVGLMVAAGALMFLLETAKGAFDVMLAIGAGTGLIYLLRWFWWRVNAISEIVAMSASLIVAAGLMIHARTGGEPVATHTGLLLSVGISTAAWVLTTFLTRPSDNETLKRFVQLVRPAGPGWTRIRAEAGVEGSPDSLPQALLGWVLGCLLVYSALFGTGAFLYGATLNGWVAVVVFATSAVGLARVLKGMLRPSSGS